jgi:hypothetical protein
VKCAIILRRFQRFDEGTKSLILGGFKSFVLSEEIFILQIEIQTIQRKVITL